MAEADAAGNDVANRVMRRLEVSKVCSSSNVDGLVYLRH
jgi:hypothetical protein